jgi:ataxin-3
MLPRAAPRDAEAAQVLYFESQRAALCGVHALNTLLQGPVFTEWDLAAVGQRLDESEAALMAEAGTGTAAFAAFSKEASGNVALDGNFSIQVLEKALSVFGLSCVPLSSKSAEAAAARLHPERETGFLLNLELHWFTLRKLGRDWWRFNSLDAAPQPVSDTYLSVLLVQLQHEGWSVFVVRGDWAQRNALLGSASPNGRWFTPAEAAEAVAQAQREKVAGRTRSAANDALARAGAQGVLTLRPRRDALDDGDDDDLRRAMAASLGEAHAPSWLPQGGTSPPGDEDDLRRAMAASLSEAQAPSWPPQGGTSPPADEDLARAIAASLEDENPALRRRLNSPPQKAEQLVEPVPDEPAGDAAGALTLAFRLPGGSRLTRRFLASESLAAVAATLQSVSGVDMASHRMTHGHPPATLDDLALTLEEVQLPDRTVVNIIAK